MDTIALDNLPYETTTLKTAATITPPVTPLTTGLKATTPRDMPTMYHLDLYTTQASEQHIDYYNTIASLEETDAGASLELVPCSICSRTFNPVTLKKHINICEKMATKKRKVFDSKRQRREGTDLASYLPKNFGLPAAKADAAETKRAPESPALARKNKPDEMVRTTVRASMRKAGSQQQENDTVPLSPAAPGTSRGSVSNSGTASSTASATPNVKATPAAGNARDVRKRSTDRAAKRSLQPATEQCPHCERCFGLKAYDRHVEWCKEKSLQAAMKQGSNDKQKAKARLEARTKYKAPNLKTKRSLNREKYSGMGDDETEEAPTKISSAKSDIMSLSMTSSVTSDSNQNELGANEEYNFEDYDTFEDFMAAQNQKYEEQQRLERRQQQQQQQQHHAKLEAAQLQEYNTPSAGNGRLKCKSTEEYVNDNAERHANVNEAGAAQLYEQKASKHKSLLNLRERMIVEKAAQYMSTSNGCGDGCAEVYVHDEASIAYVMQKQQHYESTHAQCNATVTLPQLLRPNRKELQARESHSSCNVPLKAMPLDRESYELLAASIQRNSSSSNFQQQQQTNCHADDYEIKFIKSPPLQRNKSFVISGLPTDYDPFLFAKRQLEDLCSPLPEALPDTNNDTINTPQQAMSTSLGSSTTSPISSTTTTTTLAAQKTQVQPRRRLQSLQSTQETSSALTATPTQASAACSSSSTTSSSKANLSNFRRTSSLRAPRRSPMLASRPFFAQTQRPTVQRGLSDEGPISTNFLKPEEYDEMPVRSVCQNDFAITNSPRVVRRDTSASNRKNNLKLSLNTAGSCTGGGTTLRDSSEERLLPSTASKYLLKTDSLAAFLKYEQDLAKLPAQLAMPSNDASMATLPKSATPTAERDSPLISKELKDKSNILSKQNSTKSITIENNNNNNSNSESPTDVVAIKTTNTQLLPLQKAPENVHSLNNNNNNTHSYNNNNINNINNKLSQIRLEPITKPSTPLTKPSTPLTKPQTPTYYSYANNGNNVTKLPAVQHTPISLSALQCDTTKSNYLFGKERQLSECSDYIDPKLINKCDNLPVNLAALQGARAHNDSTSSAQCNGESSAASTSTSSSEEAGKASHTNQLTTKLMPITREAIQQNTTNTTTITPTAISKHTQHSAHNSTPHSSATSQRNSAEGRHLLKRKMRLGRNQFLYDASPEADSCSADDEANNRSSVEYDDEAQHLVTYQSSKSTMLGTQPPVLQTKQITPDMPSFDDFDFEEFLAKFENGLDDDEQFPLFKDCREFLMNRTFNNQRQRSTFNTQPKQQTHAHAQTHDNSTNTNKTQSERHTPTTTPLYSPSVHAIASHRFNSETHFPFTNIKTNPNPSAFNFLNNNNNHTNRTTSFHPIRRRTESNSSASYGMNYDDVYNNNNSSMTANGNDDESDDEQCHEQKRREIFISIETEQNDLVSSPNTLRNMMGNPKTVIELVDADASDNKFSKITDEDIKQQQQQHQQHQQQLPNVQLNNAKNLIQKMQEDFRQLGEEVGADLRQAVYHETIRANGGSNSSATSPTGLALGESDEMSSLDSFPTGGQSSRQLGSKLSADSAYGSLSRQRSSELSISRNRTRPSTSHTQQQNYQYQNHQMENTLPPILTNQCYSNNNNNNSSSNYKQQQQQYYNNNNNKMETQQLPNRSANNSSSSLHGQMSQSMKMSKFCHECGSKFIVEQAKFCMDCGVKRIML